MFSMAKPVSVGLFTFSSLKLSQNVQPQFQWTSERMERVTSGPKHKPNRNVYLNLVAHELARGQAGRRGSAQTYQAHESFQLNLIKATKCQPIRSSTCKGHKEPTKHSHNQQLCVVISGFRKEGKDLISSSFTEHVFKTFSICNQFRWRTHTVGVSNTRADTRMLMFLQ